MSREDTVSMSSEVFNARHEHRWGALVHKRRRSSSGSGLCLPSMWATIRANGGGTGSVGSKAFGVTPQAAGLALQMFSSEAVHKLPGIRRA